MAFLVSVKSGNTGCRACGVHLGFFLVFFAVAGKGFDVSRIYGPKSQNNSLKRPKNLSRVECNGREPREWVIALYEQWLSRYSFDLYFKMSLKGRQTEGSVRTKWTRVISVSVRD